MAARRPAPGLGAERSPSAPPSAPRASRATGRAPSMSPSAMPILSRSAPWVAPSAADDVPDGGARKVPRESALVAEVGGRGEMRIDEVDDAAAGRREILHAVGDSGWDA